MTAETSPGAIDRSNLGITLATWVFMLHVGGYECASERVRTACKALEDAPPEADLDALGQDLVRAVKDDLGEPDPDFQRVLRVVQDWYGEDRVAADLGKADDRQERIRSIRRYQFSNSRPWLALIMDRFPDGHVGEHWVMVEEVTDVVKVMDPYPWDDVDEQYQMPLGDFMVKWELAGLWSVRFLP